MHPNGRATSIAFCGTLHTRTGCVLRRLKGGDYSRLEDTIESLTREMLEGDDISTATLGFAHAWRLAEASRLEEGSARVIESADMAVRYFTESSEALPNDPRLKGFLGSFKQALGAIHDRPEYQREGWFDQKKAVRAWPEWALFTQAFGLITLDASDSRYKKGIGFMWRTVDLCVDGTVDRDPFDYTPYFAQVQTDTDARNQRACGNTDVVPYNAQGFFMVFGDLLAKAGNTEDAKVMYETAQTLPGSDTWPFRSLVDQRLVDLQDLPNIFAISPEQGAQADPERSTVFHGPYSCVVCHQGHP